MLFDWFKIDYARRFQAEAGALTFQGDHTGAVQYDVGQLTSTDVVVFDVSNPWQPRQIISPQITANGGGYTASFEVSQTVPLTYVVADQSAWQSPAAITRYAPAIDLRDPGNGADYLIITLAISSRARRRWRIIGPRRACGPWSSMWTMS